jgi:hypothetical protein
VSAVVPNITFAPLTNLLPETTSVNEPSPIVVGLIAVRTGIGFRSVTVLVPTMDGFSWLVARTETVFGFGKVAGGV